MPMKKSKMTLFQVSLGTNTKGRCSIELDLFLYTFGTFFVVLAVYLMTRGWKSCGAPEEVDLGCLHCSYSGSGPRRRATTDMIYI